MTPEDQAITPAEIKKLLLYVYKRFRDGRIDSERAKQEAFILNSCLGAVAEQDQSERLDQIRQVMKEG